MSRPFVLVYPEIEFLREETYKETAAKTDLLFCGQSSRPS